MFTKREELIIKQAKDLVETMVREEFSYAEAEKLLKLSEAIILFEKNKSIIAADTNTISLADIEAEVSQRKIDRSQFPPHIYRNHNWGIENSIDYDSV